MGAKEMDINLIEMFLGYKEGTDNEKDTLHKLKAELGGGIYAEMVNSLLNKRLDEEQKAREYFEGIISHKANLEKLKGRNMDIKFAALDYARQEDKIPTPADAAGGESKSDTAEPAGGCEVCFHDNEIFLKDLKREIDRTKRYGLFFSVLFIDLDDLNNLNISLGKQTGDLALAAIEELLKNNVRSADGVYRRGGDEFAIILPNSDFDIARKVAEKLLEMIRNTKMRPGKDIEPEFNVTVSIGLKSFDEQTAGSVESVLDDVNKLLDIAKKSGKNRAEMFREPGEEEKTDVKEAPGGQRVVISGLPISEGVAIGRAFIYEDILNEIEFLEIEEAAIEKEIVRTRNAIEHVKKDIEKMEKQVLKNLGRDYSDIFMVHRSILEDVNLIAEIEEKVRIEKKNAEHIIRNVFRHLEQRFITSRDNEVREKSFDIADLGRRLLRHLMGVDRNIFGRIPKNRVIVAKRLLPSESVHLRRGSVRAVITEKGSRNSHAAILARGLGIPYVSEIDHSIEKIGQGDCVIVNADNGEIIINPTQDDKDGIRSEIQVRKRENIELAKRFKKIELKNEGRLIRVMANAGTNYTIKEAAEFGCDGIGLYRIEQIYMQSRVFPTQEQLLRILNDAFDDVRDKEITVRLLDIGGDKTLPYFTMKDEMYPLLGMRGVRLLLKYPRILETELFVLLKLSQKYKINILVPMVTLADEVAEVREYLEKCKQVLKHNDVKFNDSIKLGSMIEVPAAVVKIDDILKHCDFVSIGTNDLVQYTMASARENAALSRYYEAGADVVLDYIEHALKQSKKRGKECGLCGEIAADTKYTEKLLKMGLENFSVSPANILKVKSKIASLVGIE